MAIPASQIVTISPRVISAGGTDLEISGLILTENPLCVFPGTLAFTSKAAVGAYFGLDSKEYLAAVKYFLGYDNSFKKPRRLHFARLVKTAIAGALLGGTAAPLEDLKEISAGSVKLSVDGKDVTAESLNFGSCSNESDVAKALAEALNKADSGNVTAVYNSNLNAYIVTSGTTGATSAVLPADESDAATTLLLFPRAAMS